MWPEPVQRVSNFLLGAGAEARVEEFPSGTPTAEDAARAAGAELAQIVKSIVFDCDGLLVLALVPGDRRADRAKVAEAVGRPRARVASPAQVVEATGFDPGGVAPFPLASIDHVLIDRTLFAHDEVWIGAGTEKHMACLGPADLARLAKARQIDAVVEAKYDSD